MCRLALHPTDHIRDKARLNHLVTVRWADMEAWWETYPGLLEAEQAALDQAGYRWKIDETKRQLGRLVIEVEYPYENDRVWALSAEFPATYPYFAPTVFLRDVVLPRHHHPFGKNLCLLAQHGEDWNPWTDTLATLLAEQLPKIMATTTDAVPIEIAMETEDHIGEPLSASLEYTANSVLIVPDDAPSANHTFGRLKILLKKETSQGRTEGRVNGLVTAILDRSGAPLVKLGVTLPSHTASRDGFWMRAKARPNYPDMYQFLVGLCNEMKAAVPGFQLELMKAQKGDTLIAGVLYMDETSWRSSGHDWVFLHITVTKKAQGNRVPPTLDIRPIRSDKGGERSWLERAPMLQPLRSKNVLLFGAGSLGAPVALHLARAGIGGLTVVDHDYLQVGNTIRWPLGWQYAGQDKIEALITHIRSNYPYTNVDGRKIFLGFPNFDESSVAGPMSDYETLYERILATDVVIDASASFRVSHFLSDLAHHLRKPYIWLTTTHGCAGGIVGRHVPNSGYGCWNCHNLRLTDHSLPLPPELEGEGIQPGGCSQATFIGAGIDSEEIALLASRLAVSTLAQGTEGHLDFDWNVGVCEVYRDGRPIAPSWHTSSLAVHPDCHICKK